MGYSSLLWGYEQAIDDICIVSVYEHVIPEEFIEKLHKVDLWMETIANMYVLYISFIWDY